MVVAAVGGRVQADLRLRHLVPPNSLTANYLRVGSMGLGACIRKVIEGAEWKQKFRRLPEGRGIGLACSSYISGAGLPIYWNNMPHTGVQLKLDRGGGVTVFCGSTEIARGSGGAAGGSGTAVGAAAAEPAAKPAADGPAASASGAGDASRVASACGTGAASAGSGAPARARLASSLRRRA